MNRDPPSFDGFCTFNSSTLSDGWPSFTLAHYNNNTSYDEYQGYLLTPNHPHVYVSAASRVSLMHEFCKHNLPDGSTWNVQRVGPFRSTGCYDWWQMSGHNLLRLKEDVDRHKSMFLIESFQSAVDTSGKPLPYPPLHLHHIHITPDLWGMRWVDGNKHWEIYERHGEWDYGAQGGSEAEPEGYGRQINFPLNVDAELNDARSCDSPPLEWFIQFALRWVPGSKSLLPVSHLEMTNPRIPSQKHQLEDEAYFFVRPYEKIVSWYSGSFPIDVGGALLYVKTHVHENAWLKGRLLKGNLEANGLGVPPFSNAGKVEGTFSEPFQVPLTSTAFSSFEHLDAYLEHNAHQCVFQRNLAYIDGFCYDRAPSSNCSEWFIAPASEFTAINFIHYTYGRSRCRLEPWLQNATVPKAFPMHTQYFIAYARPSQSCYHFAKFFGNKSFVRGLCSGAHLHPVASKSARHGTFTSALTSSFLIAMMGIRLMRPAVQLL